MPNGRTQNARWQKKFSRSRGLFTRGMLRYCTQIRSLGDAAMTILTGDAVLGDENRRS